jgi:hypothetical protein
MGSELEEAKKRFDQIFPTRESHLIWQLTTLAETGQPCDVTFYDRKPILDVRCEERLVHALMYGAGAEKLQNMLTRIRFSDGTTANFHADSSPKCNSAA